MGLIIYVGAAGGAGAGAGAESIEHVSRPTFGVVCVGQVSIVTFGAGLASIEQVSIATFGAALVSIPTWSGPEVGSSGQVRCRRGW